MNNNGNKGFNVGGNVNIISGNSGGTININSGNTVNYAPSTQNFNAPVYNISTNNAPIGNTVTYNTNNTTNNFYFDWNAINNELIMLRQYNAMLSDELRITLDELSVAAQTRSEGGFLAACRKLGAGALDFLKNIGLSVIPQFIMHSAGLM